MCPCVQVKAHELVAAEDEVDAGGDQAPAFVVPPPKMTVSVMSTDVMQVTVSKTALDVFKSLGQVMFVRNWLIPTVQNYRR